MQIQSVLNYRIIVTPDQETGDGKMGYTAFCPVLGVADDGDTIEQALKNIKGAIETYVESLVEDNIEVPTDSLDRDIVTSIQIKLPVTI